MTKGTLQQIWKTNFFFFFLPLALFPLSNQATFSSFLPLASSLLLFAPPPNEKGHTLANLNNQQILASALTNILSSKK